MRENKDFRNFYEIDEKIGHGGFSVIYKAYLKENKEKRAIKIIEINKFREHYMNEFLKNPTEEDIKPYLDDILKEIEYMKIVEGKNKENKNTVKFYEYFINKDEIAIIMELCDSNLLDYCRNKREPLNIEEIREILIQLNITFKIMNQNRLIHRDIKLENILIKYEDYNKSKFTVKLSDYSVSKILLSASRKFQTHIGTLNYMAPEIFEGKEYNEKCDLWNLGVVIYILFFKEYPYRGNTELSILKQITSFGQRHLRKTGNSYLDDLISRLLTYDPDKRINWEEYFSHPFFTNKYKDCLNKNNQKIKNENNNIKIDKEDKKFNENNENEKLKQELNKEKEKNKKLESELLEEKNKNKNLEETIKRLRIELNKNNENNKIIKGKEDKREKSNNETDKESLYKTILDKDKEIKELRNKLSRYPFELNEGEELMVVNFKSVDQNLQNYSVICKKSDIFNKIENKLYEDNEKYYETANYFTVNGIKIHKNKSLEFNHIKNNDTIILNILEI